MRAPVFCLLLLLCSCTEQAHHQAAPDALVQRLLQAMQVTYTDAGLDSSVISNKEHRNLAYLLALHLQDHPARRAAIEQGDAETADLHQFARSSIDLVHAQRPGYPVRPIITTLLADAELNTDQQLLLLACSARLLAESEVIKHSGGTP